MPVFSKSLGKMDYNSPEAIKTIANHIRVMQEELEYRLLVLDSSNISEIDASQTKIITSRGELIEIINETDESLARIRVDSDKITSEVINKIDGCYSLIEQTATEISAEVSGANDNIAKLSLKADEIELSVQDANDNISNLSLKADEIELSVQNLEEGAGHSLRLDKDGVYITDADGNQVTISGGQIDATNLNLSGRISFSDLDADTQDKVNAGGGIDAATATTLITSTLVSSPNIEGASIKGGSYYDIDSKVKMTLNCDNAGYGDMTIEETNFGRKIFRIYDGIDFVDLFGNSVPFLRVSSSMNMTYPMGSWNFNNTSVSGLHLTFS